MTRELEGVEQVHLIGIGGIGVSAVARLLVARGYQVSGSDVRQSALTEEMERLGVRVHIGHHADHIRHADVVVVSTAIPEHNVELQAAQEQGARLMHRSEVLNALIASRRTIGVTGTHGKGTISSMIAWILECAGLNPGFVIGGRLLNFGLNARDGDSWIVVEIDESDGTHHNFSPDLVVCNFLEPDHLNYYDDLEDIIVKMTSFIEDNARLQEVFINLDCEGNRMMASRLTLRPTGYGVEHATEWRAELEGPGQLPIRFRAFHKKRPIGDFELNLPGRYNVVNAMAAIAVSRRVGVDPATIARALSTYQGLENRFTLAHGGGVTVVKDYNSHPTCMRKVLESARDLVQGRLYSVFKPYRYTLTKYLQDEYGEAFEGSDEVIITTMYAANEDPIPGVDTSLVVDKIRANGLKVTHIPEQDAITAYLLERVEPGDKVIFFGGDDFFLMADAFTAELAERAQRLAPVIKRLDHPVGGPRSADSQGEAT